MVSKGGVEAILCTVPSPGPSKVQVDCNPASMACQTFLAVGSRFFTWERRRSLRGRTRGTAKHATEKGPDLAVIPHDQQGHCIED